MNFFMKKHFFTKEIHYIEVQANMKIMICFKNDDIIANDYIEMDFKEFNQISSYLFGCLDLFFPGVSVHDNMPIDQQKKLLKKPDQEKPNDPSTKKGL